MTERSWEVRLTAAAERDFTEIIRWTVSEFGTHQGRIYSETLRLAINALVRQGPDVIGSRDRNDVGKGIVSLHVAREGRAGRHFLLYRTGAGGIEILRILHDAMDLPRHL